LWYDFMPYVSVAQRRANAAREVAKLKKKGQNIQPIAVEGRKITTTFWGQSWCKNLEAYSDFSNRLPRGRTYVCNGSVVDLQIMPGKITALVSGSSLYKIAIDIGKLPEPTWKSIRRDCAGQIGSIVELLQGRLSKHVMEIVTQPKNGLFPKPGEIDLKCSCPDWAGLCKHLAATLYGVGVRLDLQPELLFVLRQVDHLELVEQAVEADSGRASNRASKKTIAAGDLADVFGIDIASASPAEASAAPIGSRRSRRRPETPRVSLAHDATSPGGKKVATASRRTSQKASTSTVAGESSVEPQIEAGKVRPRKSAEKASLRVSSARESKDPRRASRRSAKSAQTSAAVAIPSAKRKAAPSAAPTKASETRRSRRPK
jgi:uncharacterized Zn finger protein